MSTRPSSIVRLISLALAVVLLVASTTAPGCHPQPPSPSGPVTTVSSWTDTARTVLTTVRWAVPAARVICDLTVPDAARPIVDRALDGVAQAADGLALALDAYEHRGGDRCAAKASVAGLTTAIESLAQVLASQGIALGTTIERIASAAGSIADELVPACDRDAGWSSAGEGVTARLRAIQSAAVARGVVLRHVLDDLQPVDGGVR